MNNPFRYIPHPLVVRAAEAVISEIASDAQLHRLFAPGKMLGVLVVSCPEGTELPELHRLPDGNTAYLSAFSGNVGDRNLIPGFVPPIFDLLDPEGGFKQGEAEISAINREVQALEQAPEYRALVASRAALEQEMTEVLEEMKVAMAASKARREQLREALASDSDSGSVSGSAPLTSADLASLVRESQFEKAEFRRRKQEFVSRLAGLDQEIKAHEDGIIDLKAKRARLSDRLQRWIFEQFVVMNGLGERRSVLEIFEERGLVPPGGTGECAAPKLLQFAFQQGLRPMWMGEFWVGASPAGSVRREGDFYPSCSSKCGVLLPFMMRGLEGPDDAEVAGSILGGLEMRIVYEDDWLLVIDKPGGMPSVPGLDGRISALELLRGRFSGLEAVHRLDMDTKGLLVFAKSAEVATALRRQFERRGVGKMYRAVLSPCMPMACASSFEPLVVGKQGDIDLPLAPDYEDRPRQKVDRAHGKVAHTSFVVTEVFPDGAVAVEFRPVEGRTHQLRVHAAHVSGLGRPIVGDLLYGGAVSAVPSPGSVSGRSASFLGAGLQLQSAFISFVHPVTGEPISLSL